LENASSHPNAFKVADTKCYLENTIQVNSSNSWSLFLLFLRVSSSLRCSDQRRAARALASLKSNPARPQTQLEFGDRRTDSHATTRALRFDPSTF